ncbi:Flagellum site-determining protein YlxH [Sporomusa ovata DSM 2662]|uniref:Flagellar synthesis regulator FleN n=1 Tax=Sporomusa ovata TaxID=2378 RepID=A0A0U1KXV6_9FIRM|nr:MinD/ParA family protein [Sporomusa ovata]EQB29454.1 flagellar biosynthesis switch protein FlhG [Sporomusa ovata DSM 2662]CQR71504.1 Flagellar synthesis regulator FleN [Sporomusa ovata]
MSDQAEKLRQMTLHSSIPTSPIIKQNAKSRVITVTSGKGGVGKTNFTVNLALALAALNKKVLVIDADLGMANVEVVLGCSATYTILNLLEDGMKIADIATEGPHGIKFMAGGSGIYHLANLSDVHLNHIIGQISLFDNWADFILIDTGAGISRNVLKFVVAADEVIIITTPEPTAITDAYAMVKAYAGQKGTAPLKLVINRIVDRDEGQMVVDKLMRVSQRFLNVAIEHLGYVYEDRNLVKAVKSQIPLLISFPEAISSRCIEDIAQQILRGENVQQKPRGMKGFFYKFLEYM